MTEGVMESADGRLTLGSGTETAVLHGPFREEFKLAEIDIAVTIQERGELKWPDVTI